MFHMNQTLKAVLAVEPADLSKGFNGLYALACCELGEVPTRFPSWLPYARNTRRSPTAPRLPSLPRYSLIETCRKLGLNPADYLRDLLEALPNMNQSEIADWTPARWNACRESLTSESG